MADKKIGIFSALLLFGVAALFVPVTALQNSIAMAQEYYPEYEENEYYYDKKDMTSTKNNDNYKNAPIVNVEKKLFVCNNATDTPNDFLNVKVPFAELFISELFVSTRTRQR